MRRAERFDIFERMLLGKGLYPNIMAEIVDRLAKSYITHHSLKELAKRKKMRYSDFLVDLHTKKVKNTRIARKVYKDKLIKPYGEEVEWIRILR